VDTVLIFLLSYAAYHIRTWYAFYYHVKYYPFYDFFFLFIFLYYTFFEGIWQRTPGKWLTLTKVVGAGGKKASFGQVIVRSLIRVVGIIIIDSLFLPILNRTLHDYASNTHVVEI
jgi:uncharacterized RDD family membrane protein YckC